jgi:replicative DNA helicase
MEGNSTTSNRVGKPKNKLTARQQLQELGKMPPVSYELEEAVLGAMLLEREALTSVIEILYPELFYREANAFVFEAILELFKKSQPVDLLTVTQQLRLMGALEFVGGAAYVANLTMRVNSGAHIEAHSRILVELFMKRELIRIGSQIQREAYDDTSDAFVLMDRAEQEIFAITERNIRKSIEKVGNLLSEAFSEIEEKRGKEGGLTGVPSGFLPLDRVTSGFQKSDLIILAARPGMGKTAFVLSAARNAAVAGKGVLVFSLEMSRLQLVNRLISAEAEIDSEKLKNGDISAEEWKRITERTATLEQAPLYIDDTPGISILELRAKCRRQKAQNDIGMIIIDYLQLMVADANKQTGNRQEEISQISRSLKALAKELNVPVIALSQLSRQVESQGNNDKRPQLSHLRESGAIEQDADIVMFLYRPEYYKITEDEQGRSLLGVVEVIMAKHRNGSLGSVELQFIGKYTKFADPEAFPGGFGGGFPAYQGGPSSNPFGGGASGAFPTTGGIPSDFDVPSTRTIPSKLNAPPKDQDFGDADSYVVPF